MECSRKWARWLLLCGTQTGCPDWAHQSENFPQGSMHFCFLCKANAQMHRTSCAILLATDSQCRLHKLIVRFMESSQQETIYRHGRCNASHYTVVPAQDKVSIPLQIVGFAFALVSVLLATFFSSTEASSFNLLDAKDDETLDYPPDFFHAMYVLASAYVAMLFISWNLGDVPGRYVVDKGWISTWFHMATQWLSYAIYTWILLAPRIFQGREFV